MTLQSPRNLAAIPQVSAQTWGITDGSTGDLLWSKDGNSVRDIASLSKMMTFYIVGQALRSGLVNEDDEVCISHTAVTLYGTTAWLREGDYLQLQDLLYAMMLPSGNDAACGLAEHVGQALQGSEKKYSGMSSLSAFVKKMNVEARKLGMRDSSFHNPHGLPQPANCSSANDLGKLAARILTDERLRQVVGTTEYSATVKGLNGNRVVTWNNTNLLLGQQGVVGLKTGNTLTAGPCFCGAFEINGYLLVVTVTNCKTPERRWEEVNRLAHWGANQLDILIQIAGARHKLKNLAKLKVH